MTYRALKAVFAPASRIAGTVLPLWCLGPCPVQAGDVADLHTAWRGCLHRTFGFQAALTSRTLAADMALRVCRGGEEAYLSALAASPLVDGEDVARVRPALLQRARGWLLRGPASRPL